MPKGRFAVDLIGKKFNRLTVIQKLPSYISKTGHAYAVWLCRCDCKTIVQIRGHKLKNGTTKSCGCLRKEMGILKGKKHGGQSKLFKGEAAFNRLFSMYNKAAKRANRDFCLTKQQFKELTLKNCFYCGDPPANKSSGSTLNGSYIYNGLDRLNSDKGYEPDNVVPCCKVCNLAKRSLSTKEFFNKIKQIYENLNLKNILPT